MSPSMGMPGLSFALFSIHGPLSGTWWNPQLDSQSSPVWSCLYSPPFTRGCVAVCSVQTKAWPPSGSTGDRVFPRTIYPPSWRPSRAGLAAPRVQSFSMLCSFYTGDDTSSHPVVVRSGVSKRDACLLRSL